MVIEEMTETECLKTLTRTRFGRLACAHENQPYVVPIYFVYEHSYLYGFTTPGQKVEWMRSNPLVCVELDESVDETQWMSIIIFGNFEELSDTQDDEGRWNHHRPLPLQDKVRDDGGELRHAHELLQQYAEWWEPGLASSTHRNPVQPLVPVFYRIHIDRIGGRRFTPRPSSHEVSHRD
jgi:uncharacterized protein